MKKIGYYLLYGVVYVVSLLPYWALYGLSNMIYLLVYYVIRYRRKIVWKNLSNSFPEKSDNELKTIERQFYHWFCDYLFENFKLLSISDKNLLKHLKFEGSSMIEDYFDQGRDCAFIAGHYCNWEYLTALEISFVRHSEAIMGCIYHRLHNYAMDQLFQKIRSAHGGTPIKKRNILRYLFRYQQENRRSVMGYISDQTPKWDNIHLWLDFMNQDTPVFTGGERIMRRMNDAVFYVEFQRPKRGQYIAAFELITDTPNELPEHEITRQFFQRLEQSIRKNPQYYLWTHNRWKRQRTSSAVSKSCP